MFWIMFQDNAGGYDEYTGKVGSDGDEAGDKTNKNKKSVGNKFYKKVLFLLCRQKK